MNMRDLRKGKLKFFQFVKRESEIWKMKTIVMLEVSMSSLHLESLRDSEEEKKPEITKEYIEPIGGSTIPPQYSKEISQYQPSDSERTRAMEDALDAV